MKELGVIFYVLTFLSVSYITYLLIISRNGKLRKLLIAFFMALGFSILFRLAIMWFDLLVPAFIIVMPMFIASLFLAKYLYDTYQKE